MLAGFDPRWRDLPDYILGITEAIWEGRDVASLRALYASDIRLRTPAGLVRGNEAVIAGTLATLHEFPDRQLLADDVIWCGDERGGYYSSHRIITTATHLADGEFGPANGRRVAFRVVADCAAHEGVIDDEWLLRDRGALVRQLGLDPKRVAAAEIEREGGAEGARRPLTTSHDDGGPYTGAGNDDSWGRSYAATLESMMNADFAAVRRDYDRGVQLETPGGVTRFGFAGVDAFWIGLRSAFPTARFTVHHRIGREDPLAPPRAALRWSLDGVHEGVGAFGVPSGAPVHVMGISHAEFGPRGIRREYVLADEVAVWKQILLHSG